LGFLKKDFGEVDEEIFQGFESACEKFFCILGKKETWKKSLKRCFKEANRLQSFNMPSEFDFGDIDEAMFHDVERPFERILYILGLQKSVLDEVAEVCFK
jgi:hypothetical protein